MSHEPGPPPQPRAPIRVRPFLHADREFVLGLASRLVIGIPPWRDPEKMRAVMWRFVAEDVERIGPRSAVLVAEDVAGALLGFVTVGHHVNFTGEVQAYVGELAVREDAEGVGAGGALMRAAEDWAHEHGYTLVVLETGTANARAREFYRRLGYAEESVKLVKVLDPERGA
jgi:ribosomal protein S18 acetylase RimI-like enzyme